MIHIVFILIEPFSEALFRFYFLLVDSDAPLSFITSLIKWIKQRVSVINLACGPPPPSSVCMHCGRTQRGVNTDLSEVLELSVNIDDLRWHTCCRDLRCHTDPNPDDPIVN